MKDRLLKKNTTLLAVFMIVASFVLPVIDLAIPSKVDALYQNLNAIDRTRIRMVDASATEADWTAAKSSHPTIDDVFDSRSAFNAALESSFAGKDFGDSDIWDSNETYTYTVPDTECTSVIDDFEPGEDLVHVKLSIPNPDADSSNPDCFEIDTGKDEDSVPLGSSNDITKAFGWVDEATIRTYQASNSDFTDDDGFDLFRRDATDFTKFWRADEEENDMCRDYIQMGDTGNGQLHILTRPESSAQACVTEDLWNVPDGDPDHGPMNIRVGQVENRDIPAGEGENPAGEDEDGEPIDRQPSCEGENGGVVLGWIFCGIINAVDNGVQSLASIAENLLDIDSQKIRDNEDLEAVWSYFRTIATFLLLAVGLAMVISQAIGG